MKVDLIGLRVVDFVADGEPVQGIKLFLAYPEDNVYGKIVDSRFIRSEVFGSFNVPAEELAAHIGETIDIEINPKGKVVGLSLCPKQ